MPVKVVDASALGALAFGEPEAESVAAALSNNSLAAPALLWFELSSVCLKKIRKQPDQKSRLLKAFQMAHRLPIEMVAVNHLEVIRLAEEKNITTYDANYVWLTQELKGELISLDKQCLEAAKK